MATRPSRFSPSFSNRAGKLNGNIVIATVMSNIGLEIALGSEDITLRRTAVGDKYVLEELINTKASLGANNRAI